MLARMNQTKVFGRIPLLMFIGLVTLAVVLLVTVLVITNLDAIVAWVEGAINWVFNPNLTNVIECADAPGCQILQPIIYSALLLFVVITGFAYTTLLERKFIAWFQQRSGPNRVGPSGLLQPAADGVKLIFKEDIEPALAYKWVYRLAPMLKTVPVLIVIAVIPLGPPIVIPWFDGNWYRVPLHVANPNVGILWLLAITSIATYGVVLAGWASNNKYAMLGGLRASAQMISYELAFGLSLAVPIMLAGSMSLGDIMNNQVMIWEWYAFQNPLAAIILIIAVFAETSRAPFDLPEAEQELTQGYQTEYSGMKFAMFMMAEYLAMIAVSALVAATFFGGYHDGFGLVTVAPILGPLVMGGKIVLMLIFMIWVRATLPRIRYDRLMQFGWKILLPLALLAVVWTAVTVVISDVFGDPLVYGVAGAIFFIIVVGGAYLMFGRGGEPTTGEEVEETDPMITGERRDIGYGVLNIVGGLLAVPFVLYNLVIRILDNLAQINPQAVEEMAIEPVDQDNKPVASSGAD